LDQVNNQTPCKNNTPFIPYAFTGGKN